MQPIKIYTQPQIEVTIGNDDTVVQVNQSGTPIELTVGGTFVAWGDIVGSISDQSDLQTALDSKVDENSPIVGATKTKITYDSKGLVTAGADAGISDITGLQTALDLKVPYTGATGNVTLGEYGLTTGYVQFDITPTTYTPAIGNLGWNDQEGTIDLLLKGGSVSLPLGQKQVARIVNGTGGNVLRSNYQVVKVTGAQGQRLQVNLAQANNDANSADTLGLIAENINNNNEGFIITSGLVENINTTGSLQGETWADGNILYLSPTVAGRITNIKPQAPQHTVIVGFVVYAQQNNGKIFVKVDNGYEIDELHNVRIDTGTLANGQILKYNSTLSVWENGTGGGGSGVTSIATSSPITGGTITSTGTIGITQATTSTDGYLSSTDWNTFNGKQNLLTNPVTGTGTTNELTYFTGSTTVSSLSTATYPSLTELSYVKGVTSSIQTQLNGKQATLTNPITGTGTSGQVAYFNGTTSLTSEANLFWDAANDRLGIGTNSPSNRLDVNGTSKFQDNVVIGSSTLNTWSLGKVIEIGATGTFLFGGSSTQLILGTNSYFNSGWKYATANSVAQYEQSAGSHNWFTASSGSVGSAVTLTRVMAISAAGNLRINEANDAGFRLDINGTTRIQNTLTVSSGGALVTGLSSFTGTTASDGGQLGAELLSSSNWTSTGWTGDYTLGFTHTVGNTTALTNTLAAVNGTYYQIVWTITNRTTGSVTIAFGGYSISGRGSSGSSAPRATSTGTLSVTPTTDFDGTVVISIKVITVSSASISLRNSAGTVTNEIRNDFSNTNTFIGVNAGSRNLATNNTFTGTGSGQNTTSGGNNSAYGRNSLQTNVIGSSNSAYGVSSLTLNVSGSENSAYGVSSLFSIVSSTSNSAFGFNSLSNITTSNNSAFGYNAGRYAGASTTANQTSSNSLYLGYQTRAGANGNTNEVVIGYDVVGLGSNTTILGNSSTVTTGIYGNLLLGSTTDTGEKLQVTGTVKITGASSFGGNITLSLNQNASTNISVSNTTAGTSSLAEIKTISSSGQMNLGKFSSSTNAYKIVSSNDSYVYSNGSGDMCIFNDGTGKIKFATNGSSTVQWQIETSGQLTAFDAINIAFGTTTGTKIGTATTQKISFWNATPIVQPANTVAINDVLVNLGLRASGGVSNFTGQLQFSSYTSSSSYTGTAAGYLAFDSSGNVLTVAVPGALTDGDKGDITVSSSGTTWTIDNTAVTYAKIQNVTDNRLLGRSAGTNGSVQEITIGSGLSLSGGTLTSTGGSSYSISTKTANFTETATSGEVILLGDTTGGTFTITLPTAVSNTAKITIKKTAGSNTLTVDGNGSQTIDGGLTASLVTIYESITLVSDNSNWHII